MDIAVIVPVYRGEKTLPELVERIKETLADFYSFEVILVHDGGTELSWEIICKLKEAYGSLIKGIRLIRNFGQHNAILCGIEFADANFIVTIDEDLQHNPEDIIKLINCQKEENSDLVYGSYIKRRHSVLRNTASFLLRLGLSTIIPGLHKEYTSYRLIKKGIAKRITDLSRSNIFLDGTLASLSIKVSTVSVIHNKSAIGESSYTAGKLIKHTIKTLLSFSDLNLKSLLKYVIGSLVIIGSVTVYYLIKDFYIAGEQFNIYQVFILALILSLFYCFSGLFLYKKSVKRNNNLREDNPKYIIDIIL